MQSVNDYLFRHFPSKITIYHYLITSFNELHSRKRAVNKKSFTEHFSKHVLLCYKTKSLLQGIRVLKQATTYLDCIEESCCSQSKLKPQNSCLKWLLDTLFQDKMHCPFTRKSIHLMRDFESKELNCFTTREYTYSIPTVSSIDLWGWQVSLFRFKI